MTEHVWSTTRHNIIAQRDECLRCDAKRIKSARTGWRWQYSRGGETCTGAHDPSPKERALMVEGRE